MDDSKGLIAFVVVFFLLVFAGWTIANQNQITPIVAEAQAGAAIGGTTVIALEKGASLLLKLVLGAVVAGVATGAFSEFKSAYKAWKRTAQAGRWQGGPNANFQKQTAEPKLRREDLMLLALGGKYPVNGSPTRISAARSRKETTDAEELNIDL
jgi:hypothetical protein